MKKLFCLLIVIILFFSLTSCHNEQKNTSIDLLLCQSPTENILTNDVREILLPVKKGDDLIFLPQGFIFNTSGKISYVKQKSFFENLRSGITKNTSFLILKEKIENYLKSLDITSLKLQVPLSIDSINKIAKNYEVVLGYSADSSILVNQFPFKFFAKPLSISSYISDSILVKKPGAKILIVFNPQTFKGNCNTQAKIGTSILTDSLDFTSIIKKADKAFEKKQFKKSDSLYKNAIKIQPNDVHANKQIKIIINILNTEGGGGEGKGKGKGPKAPETITFKNKDRYVGDMQNNLMHGSGTYYYANRQLISTKDPKKGRYAEAGDYLIGEWFEGYVSSGVLYDKSNNEKGRIIIGHP